MHGLCDKGGMQQAKKQVKFDSSSIKDPWYQQVFREKVAEINIFAGTHHVDEHTTACKMLDQAAEDLSDQILHTAIETLPLQESTPRKSWIGHQTWMSIQQCNSVRSQLRRTRKHRMNCMTSLLFMMWVAVSRISDNSCSCHPVISIASVARAADLWNDKIPKLDWWVAMLGHALFKLCNLKQAASW